MITMRVAWFFNEHGIPAYNKSDLAQPATSYLLPILVGPLFSIFSDNVVVLIVSAIGALAIAAVAALVVHRQSNWVGVGLAVAFLFNASVLRYMYTGWEHLLEALLVVSVFLLAERKRGTPDFVLIGILAALAVLMRIDAVFLVIPILLCLLVQRHTRQSARISAWLFVSIGGAYGLLQYAWFGWLTPTTARLKAGSLPSIDFALNTWLSTLTAGSASLVILLTVAVASRLLLRKADLLTISAVAGVLLNYIYCFIVSDIFPAGRMYIAPLALLIIALSRHQWQEMTASKSHMILTCAAAVAGLGVTVFFATTAVPVSLFRIKVEAPLQAQGTSAHAEQSVLANYIRDHFRPDDGAIGLFYLGEVSFRLKQFEVADFLGKADEMIAREPVKFGPPGHNKWDIDKTLSKWEPAVIPFWSSFALMPLAELRAQVERKVYFAFVPDLAANETIREKYIFCKPYDLLTWGIYVRADLWPRISESCPRTG
jgi:hypothetical protein